MFVILYHHLHHQFRPSLFHKFRIFVYKKIKQPQTNPIPPTLMQQNDEHSVHELYGGPSLLRAEGSPEDEPSNPPHQQCILDGGKYDRKVENKRKSIQIKAEECKRNGQQKPADIKQCRICLEGEQEGRMIKPCLCSGSVTFVHEKCIIEWIKRRHDPKNSKTKLLCQMCHTPFSYKFGKRRTLDLEEFCNNYQKQKCNFILFYIFVTFLLLVTLGLIVIISESATDSDIGLKIRSILIKTENIKIIYICVVFILIIVLMFLLILFMIEYAVKSELVVGEVLNYSEVGVKKKSRIHPKVPEETSLARARDYARN